MAAPSSPPSLSRPASNVAFTCSFCRLAPPKLNSAVERANRTHTEDFCQIAPCSLEMKKLNRELPQWENIYNTVRTHKSPGYLAPYQFLLQLSSQRKE
jgi:hypothetical protein